MPISEDEPQKPINPYGNTKLAIEKALVDYAAAYGWGCVDPALLQRRRRRRRRIAWARTTIPRRI